MIFTFGVAFVLIFDSSSIANKKQSKRNIVKTKVESIGYKVKTLRANFTGQIETRSEEGFLGLTFSPDFQTDSKFFVNVIIKEGGKDYSKILEFEWKD